MSTLQRMDEMPLSDGQLPSSSRAPFIPVHLKVVMPAEGVRSGALAASFPHEVAPAPDHERTEDGDDSQ
jgi:hypothetical protein